MGFRGNGHWGHDICRKDLPLENGSKPIPHYIDTSVLWTFSGTQLGLMLGLKPLEFVTCAPIKYNTSGHGQFGIRGSGV